MIANLLSLAILFLLVLFSPALVLADQPHYTLIVNQVRGEECCDPGSLASLNGQLAALSRNNLPATFALRFDALTDSRYVAILKSAPQSRIEIAGMLEIIPSLASASGVIYKSNSEKWYEPSSSFLVGYVQDDREKLIDTYMSNFKKFFGYYPTTTVAWLVDTYSLGYLRQKYGVLAHEITREQWNTDAITLYGGPPHYPYFPSPNWGIVPVASVSANMPMVFRQTIADPVDNYGDSTNSHTSQPNDYFQGRRDFQYFVHLFNQAHQQEANPYTFAVLGLENSMPSDIQQEFSKQLDFVGNWAKNSKDNFVVNARDFTSNFRNQSNPAVVSYEGDDQDNVSSRAWWITTPSYRVRLRSDSRRLYISDLRIYSESFFDPYFQSQSSTRAYWIVPYLVDSSRFRQGDSGVSALFNPLGDGLKTGKAKYPPVYLLLAENIDASNISLTRGETELILQNGDQAIAKFAADYFSISEKKTSFSPENLGWKNLDGTTAWGMRQQRDGDWQKFFPWSQSTDLARQRQENSAFLLPALLKTDPDPKKTIVYVNNRYSIAGRNPARILLLPKNDQGYPVAVVDKLEVTTNPAVTNVAYSQPDENSGGIFVDVTYNQPGKVTVKIKISNLESSQEVFFAPDCRKDLTSCLSHPWHFYWYGRNLVQEVYNKFK